mgnify:CR=1 FL=1
MVSVFFPSHHRSLQRDDSPRSERRTTTCMPSSTTCDTRTHAHAQKKKKRKEKRVLFLLLLSLSLFSKKKAQQKSRSARFLKEREREGDRYHVLNIFPFFHINPKHFEALFRVLNFQKKKRERKRDEREKERGDVFVHITREETLRLKGTPYAHTLHKAFCGPLSLSLSLSLLFERRLLFERLCVFVVVERTRERELSAYFYPSKSLSVF